VIDVIGSAASVQQRLAAIQAQLTCEFPAITRLAVAIYEPQTDTLRSFVHSTDGAAAFRFSVDKLGRLPMLADLAHRRTALIVPNLANERENTPGLAAGCYPEALESNGYLSNYTVPLYESDVFLGFVMFDSPAPNCFSALVVDRLSLYRHVMSLFVVDFLRQSNVLRSAVAIARDFGIRRDKYTGAHLERMAHYSRIIARELAGCCGFDDDFVECVFLFSPLHDIGKIAIPDDILLKRGRLTPAEFIRMQRHVSEGVAIIDTIIDNFRIASTQHAQTMKNIVRYHHERYDGTGYLEGLAGEAIPIEARIVGVADVFDALTSERPYKPAMSNASGFDFLSEGRGSQFDHRCVDALIANQGKIGELQERLGAGAFDPPAAATER
jgi:Response regulator containing a CheY-like receiver domain and an HD-GYP domain